MLNELERFIRTLLAKLSKNELPFYLVSSVLNFLENPKNQAYFTLAQFSAGHYKIIKKDFENLIPKVEALHSNNVNYTTKFHSCIAKVLLKDINEVALNGVKIKSNLTFTLVKSLPMQDVNNFIGYVLNKKLYQVLWADEVDVNSNIFSTILHELLERGLDATSLKCAMFLDNRSTFALKNFKGQTTVELAIQNKCNSCARYLMQAQKMAINSSISLQNLAVSNF
jgi:hypothetical protein